MTTTTMAALKASLKTELEARDGLSGVQVSYGQPGTQQRREALWLGATELGSQEIAAFRSGTQRRRESYELHVWVEVSSKRTPEDSEARAVALMGELEDLVAVDPKVNDVPNLLFVFVNGMEMDTIEGPEGPLTTIDVTLQCEGRLL